MQDLYHQRYDDKDDLDDEADHDDDGDNHDDDGDDRLHDPDRQENDKDDGAAGPAPATLNPKPTSIATNTKTMMKTAVKSPHLEVDPVPTSVVQTYLKKGP